MRTAFLTASLVAMFCAPASADMVFFERNSALSPVDDTFPDGTGSAPRLDELGFAFTPSTAIDLSGFRTKFASTDGRTVLFELFESMAGIPNTTAALVSQTFDALGDGLFSEAEFSPYTLASGQEYFFAISGIGGLGVNFTNDPGAMQVPLGEVRYTLENDPLRFTNVDSTMPENQLIVQLVTPAPVPEPSSMILLGLCGAVGGGLSWRRRKARASA